MEKPYSDSRWWDNPKPIFSQCGKCRCWHGFGKCDKYTAGIPEDIMRKSFPGTQNYDKDYCPYREDKT